MKGEANGRKRNLIGSKKEAEEESKVEKKKPAEDKMKSSTFVAQSACLIFHRENQFRQFCLRMAYGGA